MTTMQENLKKHAEVRDRITVASMTRAEHEVRDFLQANLAEAFADRADYSLAYHLQQASRIIRACGLDYMSWKDCCHVIREDGRIAPGLADEYEGRPWDALVQFATDQLVDDHGFVQGGEVAQRRAGVR